mgnify:CR=1 FL=1
MKYDTSFMTKSKQSLLRFVSHIEKEHFICSWTCYEYSTPSFEEKDLISESGSSHPINSSAIFWSIFDEVPEVLEI